MFFMADDGDDQDKEVPDDALLEIGEDTDEEEVEEVEEEEAL